MLNEAQSLQTAPGGNNSAENSLFDEFAEEPSLPSICYGIAREMRSPDGSPVRATLYSIATSEIRGNNCPGALPQHAPNMIIENRRFRVS